MSSIEFDIAAPPFSINSAYYLKSFGGRSTKKIRTQECRDWADKIFVQMYKIKDQISAFSNQFNPDNNAISISLIFYIPTEKFYTKQGNISLKSNDLTNVEKLLVDVLFDKRFHGRYLGDITIVNFNIDDKLIVDLKSAKRPIAGDYKINIKLDIISNKFEEVCQEEEKKK